MTRAELKKQLGIYRPSLIRPEMLDVTPSERKLMRMQERAWTRFEADKLAIYKNRSLTDDRRGDLVRQARDRRWAAEEKLRPFRQLCDRMRERRMIKEMASLKSLSGASARGRTAA
jgi:hypothetical protein